MANGKCFLELRKVGDLQCYGDPFLSLYYDTDDKILFLALAAYKREDYFSWLFFQVNKEDVISYLNLSLTLREWMSIYKEEICYLKKVYKNAIIEWCELMEIPENLLSDDDFFDEDFCKDRYRIINFLTSNEYTIRSSNISLV